MSSAALDSRPLDVLAAYGAAGARAESVAIGLINRTFVLYASDQPRFVLQRLHPIFAPQVNLDIEALTEVLASRGLTTPRLVRTRDGAAWFVSDGTWRMITYVPGRTLVRLEGNPRTARAAGALVGRFHAALADVSHTFHFTRPAAHDTPGHVAALEHALDTHAAHRLFDAIAPVAQSILAHARSLPPLPVTRTRIVHGDLKISNVLFHDDLTGARALIDLDTLAHGAIPVELGDALRSWCNAAGEDEAEPTFDATVFRAAIAGYAQTAGALLESAERENLVLGVETICTELAARFCKDAFEERYFGWNAERFASRAEHNALRARGQLALARSVRAQRRALEGEVKVEVRGRER